MCFLKTWKCHFELDTEFKELWEMKKFLILSNLIFFYYVIKFSAVNRLYYITNSINALTVCFLEIKALQGENTKVKLLNYFNYN